MAENSSYCNAPPLCHLCAFDGIGYFFVHDTHHMFPSFPPHALSQPLIGPTHAGGARLEATGLSRTSCACALLMSGVSANFVFRSDEKLQVALSEYPKSLAKRSSHPPVPNLPSKNTSGGRYLQNSFVAPFIICGSWPSMSTLTAANRDGLRSERFHVFSFSSMVPALMTSDEHSSCPETAFTCMLP